MRRLLTGVIRIYWHLWPEGDRRTCVYRESCSRHVHWVAQESGFWAGCKALKQRYRSCRPGYELSCAGETVQVHLADGSVIGLLDASETIKQEASSLLEGLGVLSNNPGFVPSLLTTSAPLIVSVQAESGGFFR